MFEKRYVREMISFRNDMFEKYVREMICSRTDKFEKWCVREIWNIMFKNYDMFKNYVFKKWYVREKNDHHNQQVQKLTFRQKTLTHTGAPWDNFISLKTPA